MAQKGVKIGVWRAHFETKKSVKMRVKNTDFGVKNGPFLGYFGAHFWAIFGPPFLGLLGEMGLGLSKMAQKGLKTTVIHI